MQKRFLRIVSLLLVLAALLPGLPVKVQGYRLPDLTDRIHNSDRRSFVMSMLSYHLKENTAVQKTLEEGYSALFFFEGCSDNMDDPMLSDLSYYRVSAVCIALRLNRWGQPEIVFFSDDCSTLPDRPQDYTLWEIEGVGNVGPATICDGTYELYSVYHVGSYEALHLRTSYEDATAAAVYLTPEGFTTNPATYINIHTRTGNHILQEAVWSAGCLLVGDGDFTEFQKLIASTYYANYGRFFVDRRVGTVTINRLPLYEQMVPLYGNREAVELLLTSSRCEDPGIYLERCTDRQELPVYQMVETACPVEVMTLPCTNGVDSRSIAIEKAEQGSRFNACATIVNTQGEVWYEILREGKRCYVFSQYAEEAHMPWWNHLMAFFFNAPEILPEGDDTDGEDMYNRKNRQTAGVD